MDSPRNTRQSDQRDFPNLGGTFPGIPGIPVNSNIQVFGLLFLGWLFSAVAAKYGLDTSQLKDVIVNTDAEVHTRITEGVANYEKWRAIVVGALILIVNGGTATVARGLSKDNASVAESNSRAMVARSRVMEVEAVERTRSLELELEQTKRGMNTSMVLPNRDDIPTAPPTSHPPTQPLPSIQ